MTYLPVTEEDQAWQQAVGKSLDAMIKEHRDMVREHGTPPLKLLAGLLNTTVKTFGTEDFLRIEDLIDLFVVALDRLAQQEVS